MNKFVLLFVIALCGTCTSSAIVNRMQNGQAATDTQFPYMASLQQISQVSSFTRGHRCGGALVNRQHVVTAASCLFNSVNGVYSQLNPAEYRVFAGAAVLTNDASADRVRTIESFTVHPDYRPGTPFVNDVAVIKLTEAFPDNVAGTVPLATTDATPDQINGCAYSGWGSQNATSTASTQLLHVQKTVIENQVCAVVYATPIVVNEIAITNSMICATAIQSFSSCAGDNGNPLVCGGNLNGILIQGNSCEPMAAPLPEVFTRISSFRSWIISTSGASTFQPGMAVVAVIAIVQILTANVLH